MYYYERERYESEHLFYFSADIPVIYVKYISVRFMVRNRKSLEALKGIGEDCSHSEVSVVNMC